MKTKLIILATFITLLSCKNSDQKVESEAKVETTDSISNTATQVTENHGKAPDFSLADINGKRFDLSDFKGKYVYMDIWATWCGPCKVQIPYMKQLEEQFRDAPIHFVSVSVDNDDDKPVWAKMVRENEMSGVQLFAGRENNFGFDYKIQYIPTFILIDKEGNIINPTAPAPMDYQSQGVNQELVSILSSLK